MAGVIGNTPSEKVLKSILENANIDFSLVFIDHTRPTTV